MNKPIDPKPKGRPVGFPAVKGTLLAVVLCLPLFAATTASADEQKTLRAIRLVESGDNPEAVGRCGEQGAYQFQQVTWRTHTDLPFSMAHDPATADRIAVLHLVWIQKRLTLAGIAATTYNVALAWNAGVGAVINGRFGASSIRYADRVVALSEK